MNTLFEPDVCVSEDYRWVHRRRLPQPETALLLAVLEEAIATFQKFAFSDSLRGKNLFREADNWIHAEDYDWPFSFNNICDLLGLEPAWLKNRLGEWKEQPQARSMAIKTGKARRIVGDRLRVLLGKRTLSQRMRVTTLAIGPTPRTSTSHVGKLTRGEHHGNGLRFRTSHLEKKRRASNGRMGPSPDAMDPRKINHSVS